MSVLKGSWPLLSFWRNLWEDWKECQKKNFPKRLKIKWRDMWKRRKRNTEMLHRVPSLGRCPLLQSPAAATPAPRGGLNSLAKQPHKCPNYLVPGEGQTAGIPTGAWLWSPHLIEAWKQGSQGLHHRLRGTPILSSPFLFPFFLLLHIFKNTVIEFLIGKACSAGWLNFPW